MPQLFVKLRACDGFVPPRWWVGFEWPRPCGRPIGHEGKHKRTAQPGDRFYVSTDGVYPDGM